MGYDPARPMRTTHRPLTVVAVMLSLFMAALEATVVSTAMPTVIGELGGIQLYAWVFSAYLLASTVTVPIYGKWADLSGRKPVMLFGLGVFIVGSALSGMASSMPQLILFRALQGLGAGAMQPIALTIIGDIFTLEERGRVQGLFGAVWGVAGIIGPFVGGVIVQVLSWHWVFFINVPFGLAAAAVLTFALHEKVEKRRHSLDFGGAALLSAGVLALLASSQRRELAMIGVPAGLALLGLFVWVEGRVAEPLIPLSLLRRREMAVTSVLGALMFAGMYACFSYVPLFVQGVQGASPSQAGAAVAPMVVSWPIASALGGRLLSRLGFRLLVRGGLALAALGAVGLAVSLKTDSPLIVPQAAMTVFGAGLGFANTALLIAVQTSVGWTLRGVATAATLFFRNVGGALAVGMMGALLASELTRGGTLSAEAASELLAPHGKLDPAVRTQVLAALTRGLGMNFWILAGTAVAAFAISWAFPYIPATSSAATGAEVAEPP